MPRRVLVLNATFEPINVCSVKRAVVLVLKERADMLAAGEHEIRGETLSLPLPHVIKLRTYVIVPRGERRRLSRRVVLARDGHRCQYCGSTRLLTLDHVIPRSRGGGTSWDNVVTSCSPCNTRKGSYLPSEIGMIPHAHPRPPSLAELLSASPGEVPDHWRPFLEVPIAAAG